MAIHFPVFDFNETAYDQSKDTIIAQNTLSIQAFNAFRNNIKDVRPSFGMNNEGHTLENFEVISGEDYYEYLKAHPESPMKEKSTLVGTYRIPDINDESNELLRKELYQYVEVLRSQGRVGRVRSNYFAETPGLGKALPSTIPTIPLKDYLIKLQNQLEESAEGWVKRSSQEMVNTEGVILKHIAEDPLDDVKYNLTEINDAIASVLNTVEHHIDYMVVEFDADLVVEGKRDGPMYAASNDPANPGLVLTTEPLNITGIYLKPKRLGGNLGLGTTLNGVIPGVRMGESRYTARMGVVSTELGTRTGPTYAYRSQGFVAYENGVAQLPKRDNYLMTPTIVTSPLKVKAQLQVAADEPVTEVVVGTQTYTYAKLDTKVGSETVEYKELGGKPARINDAETTNIADSIYLLQQMATKYVATLGEIPVSSLEDVAVFDTSTIRFTNTLERKVVLHIPKEALLEIVKMYRVSIKIDFDGLSGVINDQKNTPLGKVLKASGYLESLVQVSSLNKMDDMYLAYYIPLTKHTNSLRDEDLPIDRGKYARGMKLLGSRVWKYVDVCIGAPKGVAPPGDNQLPVTMQAVVAIVPNWDAIRKAPPRLGGMLLGLMMKVENQPSKPAKNWTAAIMTTIAAIIITVATGFTGTPLAYIAVAAAWAGAVASIAYTLTEAKTWATIGQVAGIVSTIASLGTTLKATAMSFTSKAIMFTLQLANIGITENSKNQMKKLESEAERLESEHRDIIQMDDHFEVMKKVDRFIFTDSYNEKYEYGNRYKDRPKRC